MINIVWKKRKYNKPLSAQLGLRWRESDCMNRNWDRVFNPFYRHFNLLLELKPKIISTLFRSKFTNKETSQQGGQQLDVVSTCPDGNSKITGQEMVWNGLKSLAVVLTLIMATF